VTTPPAEPRWPAIVAFLAVGGLHMVLPRSMTLGPTWALAVVLVVLIVPTYLAHRRGRHALNQILGYALTGVVTVAMSAAVATLVSELPKHTEPPVALLRSAAILWIMNVLVFASWYWRLDGGGPNRRDVLGVYCNGAFLFPQMTMHGDQRVPWRPKFVDYLFLAFTASAAFSPTDTPILSRWAKLLMMVQALISFMTVAVLLARAVNVL
jgi:uncharacterized membrane protein